MATRTQRLPGRTDTGGRCYSSGDPEPSCLEFLRRSSRLHSDDRSRHFDECRGRGRSHGFPQIRLTPADAAPRRAKIWRWPLATGQPTRGFCQTSTLPGTGPSPMSRAVLSFPHIRVSNYLIGATITVGGRHHCHPMTC